MLPIQPRNLKCEVPSCYNNNKKDKNRKNFLHSFYRIPGVNREEVRRSWLEKINITEEYLKERNLKHYYICDRHFCSSDYGTSSLIRQKAIPSLHLEPKVNIL